MPKNNNQSQHNWCVFWTSADLFSFHENTPLSSFDMALQYFNNDLIREENIKDYTDIGANITLALIMGQTSKGICLEDQTNFTNGDWDELSKLFKKISAPEKKLTQIICENQLENTRPFNEIPKDIQKILDQLTGDKKTAALLDIVCKKRHPISKYGVGTRTIEQFSSDKIMERLDTLLSQNNPASISYDWNFITNKKEYTKMESNHSSTVIGRRKNQSTNECEYKIKDSAGNRCPKNTIYECLPNEGALWVPKSSLQNNIYEVNWLQKLNR
jgi:hypothetical protein